MRIVLDTNVFISAALKRISMPGMAALVVERRGVLLKSLATEQQLFEVVARPYFASLIDADTRADNCCIFYELLLHFMPMDSVTKIY